MLAILIIIFVAATFAVSPTNTHELVCGMGL
jgi:cytochrome b